MSFIAGTCFGTGIMIISRRVGCLKSYFTMLSLDLIQYLLSSSFLFAVLHNIVPLFCEVGKGFDGLGCLVVLVRVSGWMLGLCGGRTCYLLRVCWIPLLSHQKGETYVDIVFQKL